MTPYRFEVAVPASGAAPTNLAAAAIAAGAVMAGYAAVYSSTYLPAARIECYMKEEASSGNGYLGPSNVAYDGANRDYVLDAAPSVTVQGGSVMLQSQEDRNSFNLGAYNFHGAVEGSTMVVVYHQA